MPAPGALAQPPQPSHPHPSSLPPPAHSIDLTENTVCSNRLNYSADRWLAHFAPRVHFCLARVQAPVPRCLGGAAEPRIALACVRSAPKSLCLEPSITSFTKATAYSALRRAFFRQHAHRSTLL